MCGICGIFLGGGWIVYDEGVGVGGSRKRRGGGKEEKKIWGENKRKHPPKQKTHLPPPHIPSQTPAIPRPPFGAPQPQQRTRQETQNTYVRKGAVRQLAVPFILDAGDFPRGGVVEDPDLAGDGLFLADALDDVAGAHVEPDRVAAVGDFGVETLDFGKGGLESVLWGGLEYGGLVSCLEMHDFGWGLYPLRLVLLPASGYGEGIFEDGVVGPELEFL